MDVTEQTGPVVGDDTSPFPARYGSVRSAAAEPELTRVGRPAPRQRVAERPARPAPVTPDTWAPPAEATPSRPAVAVTQPGLEIRRLVRRLDAWTVFKVSLVFYLLMFGIVLVGGVVAWHVAVPLHFIRDIQKAVRTLADDRKFVLHPLPVLKWSAVAGGALVLLGTVLNTIAAVLYNLISDLIGGVQTVEVVQADDD